MATKYGKVSSINPALGRARVVFNDAQNMVSAELPIRYEATGKDKCYHMPGIGEQVIVDVPDDSTNGDGVIIGSYYSEAQPPECTDPNKWCIKFANGDYIEHDNSSGDLKIIVSGNITINGARIDLN